MYRTPSDDKAQEASRLTAPLEILGHLKQLQDGRHPLMLIFGENGQRFGSFVVEIDRELGRLAIDELLPQHGERLLSAGMPFLVDTAIDGVRITWRCQAPVTLDELQGSRCYWLPLPTEITYHQRRNAFRAAVKGMQVDVLLEGDHLAEALPGQMVDLSASGCRLRFKGNFASRLRTSTLYDQLNIDLPDTPRLRVSVEIRHLHYQESLDHTLVGVRFQQLSGAEQRTVDRFVYQLQREARRFEKGEL